GATAVSATGSLGPRLVDGGRGALLPVPDPAGLGDVEAGLLSLYALQSKQSAMAARDAELQVRTNQRANKAQLDAFKQAMQRQQNAERKARGFWAKFKKVAGTVAKIASVVASVAAVACSGGAALPLAVGIAGVALSGGGMAVRELKLLGKDSDKVGMWMEIGGAGIGLGSAAAAALGLTAAAASGGSSAMRTVGTGATLTNAGATGMAAGARIAIADHQHDADNAAVDGEASRLAMERLNREAKLIIESSESAAEASKEALVSTQKALESCNRAADVALAGVRG
ncbi:MAG: hypothetical protein KF795_24930, partial [Labilithrix sp.]|nr:hypothetical protein [Labilithrix sp.]